MTEITNISKPYPVRVSNWRSFGSRDEGIEIVAYEDGRIFCRVMDDKNPSNWADWVRLHPIRDKGVRKMTTATKVVILGMIVCWGLTVFYILANEGLI